jgi:hypothetical protein
VDKRKSDAPDSFEFSPLPSNGTAFEHDKGHVPNKGARLAFPSNDVSLKHDGVYPQGFPSIFGLIKLLYTRRSLHVKLFGLNVNFNSSYVFKCSPISHSTKTRSVYLKFLMRTDRQMDIATLIGTPKGREHKRKRLKGRYKTTKHVFTTKTSRFFPTFLGLIIKCPLQ